MTYLQNRREFLKTSAAAAGAVGLGLACDRADATADAPPAPLSILVLGGTGFIGPHMVRDALSRGHTVTLFNRGRTNTHLFPELEKLVGDRDGNLTALEGRRFDAVIDNSGFVPRHVRDSAELLADSGRYMFVSSISAYKDLAPDGITEDYEVGRLDDPTVEEVTGETYGPLKALCEEAVQEVFGERANIVRPGYIVGPGDPTDRWTYWPVRVSMGGDMLVPGTPEDPVQFIDARDLGSWMVGMLENEVGGVYNAIGPVDPLTMGSMLETCREVSAATRSSTGSMPSSFRIRTCSSPSGIPPWGTSGARTGSISRGPSPRGTRAGRSPTPSGTRWSGGTASARRTGQAARCGRGRAGQGPVRRSGDIDGRHATGRSCVARGMGGPGVDNHRLQENHGT